MIAFYASLVLAITPVWPLVGVPVWLLLVASVFATSLRRRQLRFDSIDLLFVLYFIYAWPLHTEWYDFTVLVRVMVFPWLVYWLFKNSSADPTRVFLAAMICSAVTVTAVMIFQVAPGHFDFSIDRLLTLDRGTGFILRGEEAVGPNAAGYFAAGGLGLALTMMRFRLGGPFGLIWSLAAAVLVGFTVIAGTRVAWLAEAVMLGMYVLFPPNDRWKARWMRVARAVTLVALLAAVAIASISLVQAGEGAARFEDRVEGLLDPGTDSGFTARLYYWSLAWAMIEAHPMGSGHETFYATYGRTTHNEWLAQLVAVGWIGTALFGLIVLVTAWHIWRAVLRAGLREPGVYAVLSLSVVVGLSLLTENISRSGMYTLWPVFWGTFGLASRGRWEGRAHHREEAGYGRGAPSRESDGGSHGRMGDAVSGAHERE